MWAYAALLVGTALAAAGMLAGGAGIRWLGGPLIILVGAVPWLAQIDQHLVLPLRVGIANVAAEVCNLLGRPALASGTTVRLGSGWVGVDEACGGIRSLQASVMVGLFFGEWLRFSWLRRAALVALGIAAALLGNFSRVIFLSIRATRGAAAFYAVHDAAGWLALAFSLALTGFVAWRWSQGPRAGAVPAMSRRPGGRAGGVGAWGCAVAGLIALDSLGVHAWYVQGEAGNAMRPHWTVRLPKDLWNFRPAPLAEASREMLLPDSYEAGSWQEGRDLRLAAYYVEWTKGSAARFIPFLHNPTVCLPRSGCELVRPLGVLQCAGKGGSFLSTHTSSARRARSLRLLSQSGTRPATGRWRSRPRPPRGPGGFTPNGRSCATPAGTSPPSCFRWPYPARGQKTGWDRVSSG